VVCVLPAHKAEQRVLQPMAVPTGWAQLTCEQRGHEKGCVQPVLMSWRSECQPSVCSGLIEFVHRSLSFCVTKPKNEAALQLGHVLRVSRTLPSLLW